MSDSKPSDIALTRRVLSVPKPNLSRVESSCRVQHSGGMDVRLGASVYDWQGDGSSVVGVDLGGTKILGGVVDADNRILGRAKRSTPAKDGGPAILKAIVDCVDEAVADAGLSRGDIDAVGIGSPGPLDVERGGYHFQCQPEREELPDRAGALGGAATARPGAQRRSRGRLRRISAGCRAWISPDHRGVRRDRDRRLLDRGRGDRQWVDWQRG